eukprot:CAMPEP_0206054496 /NCGR_PEP_ID=MMETSP1466-20131121/38153_1 /ASSEMBLY_ACC=CAM_ASM_001126 /TAXON_ID=44452 /ORGANISM="Pavlova gyrans, Strain CCMP608" /LENGTH=46 /DNA_ID= /DNA_START= /DNA_END= /DNA_ORIENTATION=
MVLALALGLGPARPPTAWSMEELREMWRDGLFLSCGESLVLGGEPK